jgi:PAS domain S-box-containing protein/putative nucleotidyltransferase with HDIG domain
VKSPLKVLLVEDSKDDAFLLQRELRKGGYDPECHRVENKENLIEALDEEKWDILITDYSLPEFSGMEALKILTARDLFLPAIMVSGKMGEETAVEAMRTGANDYILKGNYARLVPAIERELREAQIRQEKRIAELSLLESEERYRTLFETSKDAILLTGKDGRILDCNTSACKVFGFTKSEFINLYVADLGLNEIIVFLSKASELDNSSSESVSTRKSGESFPIAMNLRRTTIKGQQMVVAYIRDITKRVQDEQQIQRQLANLAALHAIDTAITSNEDLGSTIQVALDQVVNRLSVDAACILKCDIENQKLMFVGGVGFKESNLNRRSPYSDCIVEIEENILIPNLQEDRDYLEKSEYLWKNEGFVSYMGIPLIVKNQLKGILEIFQRQTLMPDQEWLEFLDALVNQISIAIDSATLFDDLHRSNADLEAAYAHTLEGWAGVLELRDYETRGHSMRVASKSVELAAGLGVTERDLVHIRRGALLHDIGKMGIPDSILLKPGELNSEEWDEMKKHPIYGYEILRSIGFLEPSLDIVLYHHERWNGSGYPKGLKGREIPLPARIFAVVDIWDSLINERPYRNAWSTEKTWAYLQKAAGEELDPEIVEIFGKKFVQQENA